MENKVCTKCGDKKLLSEFHNKKESKDGKASSCKTCSNKDKKLYYLQNKTKILNDVKKHSELNKDKIKSYHKKYYDDNKNELNEKSRNYHKLNKYNIKKCKEIYRKKNKDSIKMKNDLYRKINKEKIKEKHRLIIKNRRKTDDLYRLKINISDNIRKSFKRSNHIKTCNTLKILGCSFEEFKIYLESLWKPWMNWGNYGLYNKGDFDFGWDIDHIEPIAKAKSSDDVIRLNHYTNLQPLCSYTNRNIKRDSY
jgi:hypothetical protein